MNIARPHSTRESAIIVIGFLGIHSIVSLIGVIVLCAMKAEPATVAIIAGAGGASTGALGAVLSQTEKPTPPSTEPVPVVGEGGGPVVTEEAPKPPARQKRETK